MIKQIVWTFLEKNNIFLNIVVSFFIPLCLFANPHNAVIEAGNLQIHEQGKEIKILQYSEKAVINWDKFSIQESEIAHFVLPSSSSSIVNRVTGDSLSEIYGTLKSNGQVILINPLGVLIGPQGIVDVGGFIASTYDLKNEEYLKNGLFNFLDLHQSSASIVNQGQIIARSGDIVLVAREIDNQGYVTAGKGKAYLKAGCEIILCPKEENRIKVRLKKTGLIKNTGTIKAVQAELEAAGGIAECLAVSNAGIIEAIGVGEQDGKLVLLTDEKMSVGGTLIAKTEKKTEIGLVQEGGTIHLLADEVRLEKGAVIDVSAVNNAGEVLVGGDYQGKNPNIRNASVVYMDPTAEIHADSLDLGQGGKVILWSDKKTNWQGLITSQGGQYGGNGGFIEVSSKGFLLPKGRANTLAVNGLTGQLLLDPCDITVDAIGPSDPALITSPYQPNTDTATLLNTDVNGFLDLSNLEIRSDGSGAGTGNIIVNAGITSMGMNTLTLTTPTGAGDVTINNAISLGGGLTISASSAGIGGIDLNAGITVGGDLNMTAGSGGISFNTNTISLTGLTNSLTATSLGNVTVDNVAGVTIAGTSTSNSVSITTNGSGNVQIANSLTVNNGSLSLTANDGQSISVTAPLGLTLTESLLNMTATGANSTITLDGPVSMTNTAAVNMTFSAVQGVNLNSNLNVNTGFSGSNITATTSTGNISVGAGANINFMGVGSNNQVNLTAKNNLAFSTGNLTLQTNAQLNLTATDGTLTISNAAVPTLSSCALSMAATNGSINCDIGGFTLDGTSTLTMTAGQNITVGALAALSLSGNSNLSMTATADINLNGPVSFNNTLGVNKTFSLSAGSDIIFNGGGSVAITNTQGPVTATMTAASDNITLNTGSAGIAITNNSIETLAATITASTKAVTINSGSSGLTLTNSGAGALTTAIVAGQAITVSDSIALTNALAGTTTSINLTSGSASAITIGGALSLTSGALGTHIIAISAGSSLAINNNITLSGTAGTSAVNLTSQKDITISGGGGVLSSGDLTFNLNQGGSGGTLTFPTPISGVAATGTLAINGHATVYGSVVFSGNAYQKLTLTGAYTGTLQDQEMPAPYWNANFANIDSITLNNYNNSDLELAVGIANASVLVNGASNHNGSVTNYLNNFYYVANLSSLGANTTLGIDPAAAPGGATFVVANTGSGGVIVNGVSWNFSGFANLTGYSSSDTFSFGPTGYISGNVTGSGGGVLDFLTRGSTPDLSITGANSGLDMSAVSPAIGGSWSNISSVVTSPSAGAHFYMYPAGSFSGTLTFSANAVNTIDYSNYGAPCYVNFNTQSASGIASFNNATLFIGSSLFSNEAIGADWGTVFTMTGHYTSTYYTIALQNFNKLTGGAGDSTFQTADSVFDFGTAVLLVDVLDGRGGFNTLDLNNWPIWALRRPDGVYNYFYDVNTGSGYITGWITNFYNIGRVIVDLQLNTYLARIIQVSIPESATLDKSQNIEVYKDVGVQQPIRFLIENNLLPYVEIRLSQ